MTAFGIPYWHLFIGFTAFILFACALTYAWLRRVDESEVADD
jgi:hypothetical protein